MEFNLLVLAFVFVIMLVGLAWKIYKFKENGSTLTNKELIMNEIQPFIVQLLSNTVEFINSKNTYDEFEDFCVEFVYEQIVVLGVLTDEQLEIVNKDLIRQTIKPFVFSLWKKNK